MDVETCGTTVHDINKLTVIASENYKSFVSELQNETKESFFERTTKATIEYFEGKSLHLDGAPVTISQKQAKLIYKYLAKNDYIDDDDNVTDVYREAIKNGTLAPMQEELQSISEAVHTLMQTIFDPSILDTMIEDAHTTKITNELNQNFVKKEFQNL